GRGDNHLLRASAQMFGGVRAVREEAGRLEHDVHAEISPRQLSRVANCQDLEFVAVDRDAGLFGFDARLQIAQYRVVLEQVSERALVMSLTATKSMSRSPSAARMMFRPIRPKPLMPTRTGIDNLLRIATNIQF